MTELPSFKYLGKSPSTLLALSNFKSCLLRPFFFSYLLRIHFHAFPPLSTSRLFLPVADKRRMTPVTVLHAKCGQLAYHKIAKSDYECSELAQRACIWWILCVRWGSTATLKVRCTKAAGTTFKPRRRETVQLHLKSDSEKQIICKFILGVFWNSV